MMILLASIVVDPRFGGETLQSSLIEAHDVISSLAMAAPSSVKR